MGRTIAEYFKTSTEGQRRELGDKEEDWLGSSGDQDFFEKTSDNILANWEEYSGPKVTGHGAQVEQKGMKTREQSVEQPDMKGTEELLLKEDLTVEDNPTLEEEDDWWMEQLYTERKDDLKEDNLGAEDDNNTIGGGHYGWGGYFFEFFIDYRGAVWDEYEQPTNGQMC